MKKVALLISNEAGSSRMDTVLKMLLIAFIALLAFSSGVYFGKQLSDSDYQLKALESDFHNNHGGKLAENSHEDGAEQALNQEEAAALSESIAEKMVNGEKAEIAKADIAKAEAAKTEIAKKDTHGDTPAESHADAHHGAVAEVHQQARATVQKPDLSAATKAAMRVANNAAPTEAPKVDNSPRVPTSLPKTVGLSQDVEFTVQVASYPTPEVAKERADELIKKGFPAFPVEATVNGKVWYRVSVGSFKTQREATAYRAQLLKQANVASAIVQKITR